MRNSQATNKRAKEVVDDFLQRLKTWAIDAIIAGRLAEDLRKNPRCPGIPDPVWWPREVWLSGWDHWRLRYSGVCGSRELASLGIGVWWRQAGEYGSSLPEDEQDEAEAARLATLRCALGTRDLYLMDKKGNKQ